MRRRRTLLPAIVLAVVSTLVATAAGSLQTPEQFLGFTVGADNKLVRWDRIVEYMKLAAANSDRVRFRELGKTSQNNPFVALEISAPDTLKNLDLSTARSSRSWKASRHRRSAWSRAIRTRTSSRRAG
jgi:hypothetical protein